ncbi:MAG: hypothetical protein AAGH83_12105 [Pseudomonadota bacterium]
MVEFDRTHNPLRDDLLETPFTLAEGALAVPDAPGLGIRVREDVLRRFASD